jgi:uncharacterized coiled-coil protein SlyX
LSHTASLEARIEVLEARCAQLSKALDIQSQMIPVMRAGINANTVAMYGVLNALGYNDWVERCVSGRLDCSYEGLNSSKITQEEYDAFDTMASNFRYCMTESKKVINAEMEDRDPD